jgi:hypothetical protein
LEAIHHDSLTLESLDSALHPSSPEHLVQVAMQEVGTAHTEFSETAEFAELRSEGGHKLLVIVWIYVFQHTDLRDSEFAQVSHLVHVRSNMSRVHRVQGQSTTTFSIHSAPIAPGPCGWPIAWSCRCTVLKSPSSYSRAMLNFSCAGTTQTSVFEVHQGHQGPG